MADHEDAYSSIESSFGLCSGSALDGKVLMFSATTPPAEPLTAKSSDPRMAVFSLGGTPGGTSGGSPSGVLHARSGDVIDCLSARQYLEFNSHDRCDVDFTATTRLRAAISSPIDGFLFALRAAREHGFPLRFRSTTPESVKECKSADVAFSELVALAGELDMDVTGWLAHLTMLKSPIIIPYHDELRYWPGATNPSLVERDVDHVHYASRRNALEWAAAHHLPMRPTPGPFLASFAEETKEASGMPAAPGGPVSAETAMDRVRRLPGLTGASEAALQLVCAMGGDPATLFPPPPPMRACDVHPCLALDQDTWQNMVCGEILTFGRICKSRYRPGFGDPYVGVTEGPHECVLHRVIDDWSAELASWSPFAPSSSASPSPPSSPSPSPPSWTDMCELD